MLCKQENRDPAHCLKEGRRVTRCAQDLWVLLFCCQAALSASVVNADARSLPRARPLNRVTKLRTSCLAEFDKHWACLENNNQVG